MALAKLSLAQAASINLARQHASDDIRKSIKREIFTSIKQAFGIPADTKLKAETADTTHADFLVVKDARSQCTFPLDAATGRVFGAAQPAPAPTPQRWFKLDAQDARGALIEFLLDNNSDEDTPSSCGLEDLPDGVCTTGSVAFDRDTGDAYVLMDGDHYDIM